MPPGRLAALLLFGTLCVAPAQPQGYADLYGRVIDTSEGGIGGAAVTVVNQETGFRRNTLSEASGQYAVGSLEPGAYKITVRKEGFRGAVRFDVQLAPGASTRADFALPVGSMNESITVHGTAPMLDRDDAATGSLFEHDEIDRLPVNAGGMLSLLELVPGTNLTPATRGDAGQFTTNGQRPNSNYFTVDGVSANNGVTAGGLPAQSSGGTLPSVSAFGSLDSIISLDAVQDMKVQTSSTIAEFGRLPGAGIAISSQSGANELHGSTFFRLRNELLSANDWFANQAGFHRAPLRLYDVNQTFGGPLKHNRTFLFLSYEHMALRQPFVWEQPVPALTSTQQSKLASWAVPVLALFPPANGSIFTNGIGVWNGSTVQPARLDAGGARIDQAITGRISFFGRYNDSPSTNNYGSLDVNRLDLRAQSLTLGLSARPTAGLTLDFRVNESQSMAHSVWLQNASLGAPNCALQPLIQPFTGANTDCSYLMRFQIAGVGTLEDGREGDRRQRQFQATQSVLWHRGRHSIGIGADYRAITAVRRDAAGTLSVIADQISDLSDARLPWVGVSTPIEQAASLPELSLWAEDTWTVSQRLTLAAGLRWEYSPSPYTSSPAFFFDPADGGGYDLVLPPQPVWNTSVHDFAPRLGLAYRVTRDGRTVLRAGGGLYYDSSMSIAADLLNGGPLNISYGSQRNGTFSTVLSYGFAPDLRLPEIKQWNVSLEHGFGLHDVLSLGYVGSAGQGLIRRELGDIGTTLEFLNALTTNYGFSKYQSLQAQYRRRFLKGLELQGAYTWAHSIDNDSSDSFLMWGGGAGDRGNSDFDLRHTLSVSASYLFPTRPGRLGRAVGGWSLSGILKARSGFPITVQQSEEYIGIELIDAFRPDFMGGQPLWITDPNVPGGRRLNPASFIAIPSGVQGDLGRNVIPGFGMSQLDMALSRDLRVSDRASLQLRVSAFNALNHANFADPVKYLDSPLFGQSTSMLNMMLGTGSPGSGLSPILQTGGPRSFQLSIKLRF